MSSENKVKEHNVYLIFLTVYTIFSYNLFNYHLKVNNIKQKHLLLQHYLDFKQGCQNTKLELWIETFNVSIETVNIPDR